MDCKIALVTDSTCDLPEEVLKDYGIHMVPLKVVYKDREYSDGVDITPQEVYDSLEREVPTTSLPSPGDVIKLFNELREQGFTHIISVNISTGLSGTYNMIKGVAQDFKDMVIEVIDSKSLSLGLGFPVIEGAKAIKESLDFDRVVERIRGAIKDTKVFFVLSTLEYLRRGGRIGHVSGFIGEMLDLKPIISIGEDGKYFTHSKTRGRKQSITKLFETIKEMVDNFSGKVDIAVLHGGALEEVVGLKKRIMELKNINKIYTGQISPVMGVHTGPGLLGLVIHQI